MEKISVLQRSEIPGFVTELAILDLWRNECDGYSGEGNGGGGGGRGRRALHVRVGRDALAADAGPLIAGRVGARDDHPSRVLRRDFVHNDRDHSRRCVEGGHKGALCDGRDA